MILDATTPRECPDLHRMSVIYGWGPGGRGMFPSGDRSIIWDAEQVKKELSFCDSNMILLDNESNIWSDVWWPHLTAADLEEHRDHHAAMLQVFHETAPTRLVGVYQLGQPFYSLDDINYRRAEAEEDAVRLAYDRLPSGRFGHRGVIDMVHYLCPVLYTRAAGTETFEGWRQRAEDTVRFMRRWDKRMHALLWPYHSASHRNPDVRGQWIDPEQWRQMIQWCEDECDHACIWNASNEFTPIPDEHRRIVMDVAHRKRAA